MSAVMKQAAHTPGPWAVGRDSVAVKVFHAASASIVAYVDSQCEHEQNANARLIAAAPDMAETLREIAAFATGSKSPAMIEIARRAQAALAKAGL